ncbi:MAG TPA: L-2-hydroxyglutarate oxidase [Terriglobales bacterium]|nr:L-2-hydroxyglutarate oxidase [Terriglobales bacterium]
MTGEHDVIVIGGGIVGLSVAMQITRRFPRMKLAVLEKEAGVGRHQTGHNSGVIHSGIYYKPGSIKARTCVEGAAAMVEFCQAHTLPLRVCGKVIVATSEAELPRLNHLLERGRANGVDGLRLLNRDQLREIEPHAEGLAALHVPGTGITDFTLVSEKYAEITRAQGGTVWTSAPVIGIRKDGTDSVVETTAGAFRTGFVINCAGLFSDRVSQMAGERPPIRIIPFRGEYYDLVPAKEHLVHTLIYPVPDPRFPFLGVHFTRRIHGGVDAGPNAVLAFKREGYRRTDFSARDTLASLSFPGFWRMAARFWRSGVGESYRSVRKRAFVAALRKMVPEVREDDLRPGGSGVRAQAIARDGCLVDDFLFSRSGNLLHLYNVPSPAATASIAVGRAIVQMAAEAFSWQ